MSELLADNLTVVIVIVVVAVVVLGLGLLLLRSRKTKAVEENHVRSELAALERENQLALAAARIQITEPPEIVANRIAGLYREQLGVSVFRVYAGQEGGEILENILPLTGDEISKSNDSSSVLPTELSIQQISPFTSPQNVNKSVLLGDSTSKDGESFALIPWHGAFGWQGVIIGDGENLPSYDILANFQDGIHTLNEKLSVSLEMANRQSRRVPEEQFELRLNNFLRSIPSVFTENASFSEILETTTILCESNSAALWLLDANSQMLRMVASTGLHSKEMLPLPVGQGIAGSVFSTNQPLALEEAASDPRCLFPNETRASGIGSYLGVPIREGDKAIGVLEIHTVEPKVWSENKTALLESVATVIAEGIKLKDSQDNKLKKQSAFMGVSESLQRLQSTEDLLEAAVEVLGHALGVSRVIAIDLDRPEKAVQFEYKTEGVKSATNIKFNEQMLGRMVKGIKNGEVVVSKDSKSSTLMNSDLVKSLDVQSEIAMPVQYNGKNHFLLYIHQCDFIREWKPDEIAFTDRVGKQLALSLANLAALKKAQAGADSMAELERRLADLRNTELQARARIEKLNAVESDVRANKETVKKLESDLNEAREQLKHEEEHYQKAIEQVRLTNQLKSEFIVNSGNEISFQTKSLIALAQMLERGSCGQLNDQQLKAIRDILGWSQKVKKSLNDLIEYGLTRTR